MCFSAQPVCPLSERSRKLVASYDRPFSRVSQIHDSPTRRLVQISLSLIHLLLYAQSRVALINPHICVPWVERASTSCGGHVNAVFVYYGEQYGVILHGSSLHVCCLIVTSRKNRLKKGQLFFLLMVGWVNAMNISCLSTMSVHLDHL
jgi:hypothetical protein